ncbi:MAG: tetraacyldisaccharide 4'-kinase [Nitrospirae bacterium GWC2_46_6]|nr:MAG: tetraacyldisaccharide 4'-kinase [Nitrospirae bacterium GWA2_46_11]OGW20263.1 MAG: tetraacyldisaccharide 4'-kinase [Nitrospirae bacterium GWC2_46_6]OGW22880.1 MAG: tetraacyldisaccharide 4'-kinase [Nitrospirae bacterium GWB2_47_37]HAK89732.1 tetraacyldisaccharide 4'-kinase [Nitrospiraceae bacterium]HCL81485.1 tetraacyldisaccharide 4'-kinase [Nitrospiraceae bacterium]
MTFSELFYYIGYSLDKRFKMKRQKRLPHPVISIGNITVGGTGKTPAAIAVAKEAKRRGFYPIILTRGYKGKAKGPCFVTPTLHNSDILTLLFGDEPVLMAERLKDVPVVKCADRYEGGMFAIENFKSQISNFKSQIIFILDDGFQHWRLYRDRDIVLIDGLNPFGNRKMLPLGPLREPLKELKRVEVFVVTKTKNEPLAEELKKINPSASAYFSEYKTVKIRNAEGKEFPVETLKDKKVYAFCGIANPESFKMTVKGFCGGIAGFKAYGDHHLYSQADILYLAERGKALNCDFLITTEKDMVKIKEFQNSDFKFHGDNILCMEIEFAADAAFFDEVFKNIP